LSDLDTAGRSKHTIRCYKQDLDLFQSWYGGNILEVSADVLREYFKALKKEGLSASTIGRKQAAIQSFLEWCFKQEMIQSNPMGKIERVKIAEKAPRPIDEKVLEKIFKVIPKNAIRDRLLFTLIRDTGIRISEALGIYVEDLNLALNDEKIRVVGKGNRERTVMLYAAPDTLKLLKRYLRETGYTSGPLFRGASAAPMAYRTAHELWTQYCRKAGADVTIHALRHTFATDLINEGVDVTVVRKLLGHRNLQTTMRYSAVSEKHIKSELMAKHRKKTS
jgi:integrase/recombinase XerD